MATSIALGSAGEHSEQLRARLVQVARRILGDRDLAEDVAQEVLMAWHAAGGRDRQGEPIRRGWLVKAAKNRSIDLVHERARGAEIERLRESPLFRDIDHTKVIALKDLYLKVHRLFSHLKPPVAREIIRLHIQEGVAYDQICERLNISSEYARTLVCRGLKALREQLATDGTDKLIWELIR